MSALGRVRNHGSTSFGWWIRWRSLREASRASHVDSAAILVDPLDVGAIARALQRLIDDRGLAAALGAAARARASTFTWERTAELAAAVYAEAAEAGP